MEDLPLIVITEILIPFSLAFSVTVKESIFKNEWKARRIGSYSPNKIDFLHEGLAF